MKMGYIGIIIFFENTFMSQMENRHIFTFITNYKENCEISYDMLVSMSWNQQILPYFHKELTEFEHDEDFKCFYTAFDTFLIEYFIEKEKEDTICKNRAYKFYIKNYDFFNKLYLDNRRQNSLDKLEKDVGIIMINLYNKYYDFMQTNKEIIKQSKTLFTFYVLQHYINDNIDHLPKYENVHVDLNIIYAYELFESKKQYLYDYLSFNYISDHKKSHVLGIFIDPAFNYNSLKYNVVNYFNDLLQEILNFIHRNEDIDNSYKFDSIELKFIIPEFYLPLFTEESCCNNTTKNNNDVIHMTYALKKSAYNYLDLVSKLKGYDYLIEPSEFSCNKNKDDLQKFYGNVKRFYGITSINTAYHYSNYTEKSSKKILANANIALVEYLTNKFASTTIRLELHEEYKGIYFKDKKIENEYGFLCNICQIFFKEVSIFLNKFGLKHDENSFTFYTYMLNVLEDIKSEEIFTFKNLQNFYDTYIEKTIEFNLDTEPMYINIIHKKCANDNSNDVSKIDQMRRGQNSFGGDKIPNLNEKFTKFENTIGTKKKTNLSVENTKLGDTFGHFTILKKCVSHAIYAILYNCSLFKTPLNFHMLLNELNFHINTPNLSIINQSIKKTTGEMSTPIATKIKRYFNTRKTVAKANNGLSTYHICNYYYLKRNKSYKFDDKEKLKIQKDINGMFINYYSLKKSKNNKHCNHVFVIRVFNLNCTCFNRLDKLSHTISNEVIIDFIYLTIENFIKSNKDKLPEFIMLEKNNVMEECQTKLKV
ncbi:hypothetical protein COBT_001170 [Conglomerata obtusa]